jgi:hypothetical protein
MDPAKEQHPFCAKHGKRATEIPAMIRQAFGYLNSIFALGQNENARQVNSKAKSMLLIFFDLKGIVHKEFDLADQTVDSCVLL